MGVKLRLSRTKYGLRICDKISGGSKQGLPTNITYADNEERANPLGLLPHDDTQGLSPSNA